MNDRIKKLRDHSLNAVNRISAERALLVTEFYKSEPLQKYSYPITRALCFKYVLENKSICILYYELIVSERGPVPKSSPTYPEVNLHSLQDLDILNSREKVFFKVDDETCKAYEEIIIPFWKGKSHRERMMKQMSPEWLSAYEA